MQQQKRAGTTTRCSPSSKVIDVMEKVSQARLDPNMPQGDVKCLPFLQVILFGLAWLVPDSQAHIMTVYIPFSQPSISRA